VIGLAMQKSNQVMANSNTQITFELAYKYQTDYTELNTSDDLERLQNMSDGYMDEVHVLRRQYQADLVMLIPSVTFTGGLGYLLQRESGFPDYAFALSRVQQTGSAYTMVHEMGHNMGCSHHKIQGGSGLYPYSYGWRGLGASNTRLATVMTYEDLDDGQGYFSHIPYFSDPAIFVNGVAIGDVNDGNNALTLRRSKHVTSRYSDIIGTSLSRLTISQGTLSPAFNPDSLNYTVTVSNEVQYITVTGTANYPCASVTGNVANRALSVGANVVAVSAISHEGSVRREYTITVNRLPSACDSYASRPIFNGNVSARTGSDELHLNMTAANQIILRNQLTISTLPPANGDVYVKQSASSNACHKLGPYYIHSGPVTKFRVTKTGNYTFTNNVTDYVILSLYNSETASCEGFITSNAHWAGTDGNTSMSWSVTALLNADTDYYMRTVHYQLAQTWDISVTAPSGGELYTESSIPLGMGYTYIAIDQQDNKIKAYSATADFRTLLPGNYTIYGVSFSQESNPANFTGKTLAEIQISDCVTASATSMNMTVLLLSYIRTPDNSDSISAYYSNQVIHAVSDSSDPIRRIDIYNTQGALLFTENKINTSYYTVKNKWSVSGVYIVRLTTGQGVKTFRILAK
jgi:hypothetical protein